MKICRLFISLGHNFFGRRGLPPAENPLLEVAEIECVAGSGIRGDRFFNYKKDYQGQVTFFSREVFFDLCREFNLSGISPGLSRRNIIVEDADLNLLIGAEFEVQHVCFAGTAECSPCRWMNLAFAPGAENFLRGRGGLRARVLGGGILRAEK